MKKQTKVDRYIRRLERELEGLAPEARAGVVTEVRGHLKKSLANGRTTDEALAELGSPKLTAKAYLKPCAGAEPRTRWVRWLAMGTVALFALIFFGGLTVIWRLSPGATDRTTPWWAPRLKLDDSSGRMRTVESVAPPTVVDQRTVIGARDLNELGVAKVRVPFNIGKLILNPGEPNKFKWTCETSGHEELEARVEAGVLTLDLDALSVARCTLDLPPGLKVEVRGVNGHLEINRPVASLDVQLTNGRVSFTPDPAKLYDADVHVKNGLQDFFRRSANARATKIKIMVTNGTVKKE